MEECLRTLPGDPNVSGSKDPLVVNEVLPDNGVWRKGVLLKMVFHRTIQALLYQPGEVTNRTVPILIVLEQFLTNRSDLVIVQVDQAQFTVYILDHVQHNLML